MTVSNSGRDKNTHRVSPSQRSLAARIGAYHLHASYDSRQITAAARKAFMNRFEIEVDPRKELPEAERLRRAEAARKAYFTRLAYQSAKARAGRSSGKDVGCD